MLRTRLASRILVTGAVAALAVGLVGAPASAGSKGGATPVLISDEVVSPLHLAVGKHGRSLYVADSFAGAIEKIDLKTGNTTTVADAADGIGSPAGVAVRGGRVYVVGSGDGDPEGQGPTYFGKLRRDGSLKTLVDLLAVERQFNPDHQVVEPTDAESNPYDVLAYRGGFIVADSAANALIRISPNGDPSVLTAFPLVTVGPCATNDNNGDLVGCDPVPTGIALGPDGLLYVSGLGAEQVGQLWVVDPRTGAILYNSAQDYPEAPPLTDVAVSPDGSVFLSSLFTDQVFRLRDEVLTVATVKAPAGLAWTHGTLYVGSVPTLFAPEGTFLPGAVYAVPQGAFGPLP